jgi:hypothetical protein
MTAVVVILPTLFIPSENVLNLCSMGTLVAFVLVCAGVLKLQHDPQRPAGKFRTPYINGRFFLPAMMVGTAILVRLYGREWFWNLMDFQSWARDQDKIPMYLFFALCIVVAVLTVRKSLSLIPTLGLLFSFFMMAQIPLRSWVAFSLWLIVGLIIYFMFSIRHSRLATAAS